jgi:hypothetical protein
MGSNRGNPPSLGPARCVEAEKRRSESNQCDDTMVRYLTMSLAFCSRLAAATIFLVESHLNVVNTAALIVGVVRRRFRTGVA